MNSPLIEVMILQEMLIQMHLSDVMKTAYYTVKNLIQLNLSIATAQGKHKKWSL